MKKNVLEMSHSLNRKLSKLELQLATALQSQKLEDLCSVISRLEEIVTCKECRKYYCQCRGSSTLETQLARLQTGACHCIELIEKMTVRTALAQDSVDRYLVNVSQSAVREAARLRLTHRSHVLFIGSGARPTSCHAISAAFGCKVVGIDTDLESVELAQAFSKSLAQSPRLSFQLGDGKDFDPRGFSHIVVASLVKDKHGVLSHLSKTTRGMIPVALRFGEGLHQIINFPLPRIAPQPWKRMEVEFNPGGLYQTVILSGAQT